MKEHKLQLPQAPEGIGREALERVGAEMPGRNGGLRGLGF